MPNEIDVEKDRDQLPTFVREVPEMLEKHLSV